ncbi:MAG: hypothetical protein ACOYY2_01350 [Actinomycetota bacterium]
MRDARLTLDPAFTIGPVDRRLFGTFVEHMWLDRLDLVAGRPVLRGPTDAPQPVPRLS